MGDTRFWPRATVPIGWSRCRTGPLKFPPNRYVRQFLWPGPLPIPAVVTATGPLPTASHGDVNDTAGGDVHVARRAFREAAEGKRWGVRPARAAS